ncbi:MAG: hypothetical protein H6898_16880 [Rhodobacter sp.]|nr:hypothetical protein [Paracoccaceae bacterium]MCC0078231.1 hypothetical protein [Rhodobacter sp.]
MSQSPRPFHRTLALAALMLVTALPAQAQWLAVGRWGTDGSWRYVQPGTWMVLQENGGEAVSVSAEAENHDGRLEFWCRREAAEGGLVFDFYFGDALNRPEAEKEPQIATLQIDGQTFDTALSYDPEARNWHDSGALRRELLDAFSWGSSLELVNAAGDTISRFRLNNSGSARSALRNTCGL